MAEHSRRVSGSPAGTRVPPAASASGPRVLSAPANDNAPTPLQRLMRAVLFVGIGAIIAWTLHQILG